MYQELNYEQFPVIITIAAVLLMIIFFLAAFFPKLRKFLVKTVVSIFKKPEMEDESLEEIIHNLGYGYDKWQDIFYSKLNGWQRDMGYCRLYDEVAAPMSMIIDCEPIYFEYDNKKWLIEFWKGQYGMTTGCEVGVYSTHEPDIKIDYYNGTLYECAGDEDLLSMSFELDKNNRTLMKRSGVHWWLTGFKLGEFSQPHDLVAFIAITLKDSTMRNEFVKGLKNAGYRDEEIVIVNETVRVAFDKPRTKQPYTRNELTEYYMQSNNKELINRFNALTENKGSSMDKIMYLRDSAPEMYEELLMLIGRNKNMFSIVRTTRE